MILFLSCFFIAELIAEKSPIVYYGLKGGSVCLPGRLSSTTVEWAINAKVIVKNNGAINPIYYNVDYNIGNKSLCIRELNETDSDVYTVTGTHDFEKMTVSYRLTVQEAVSKPAIQMIVLNSSVSTGHCKVTVNCSVQDSWLWSACTEGGCGGGTSQRSFNKVNITISVDNGTVVCHGNNHVSASNISQSMEGTCFNENNTENPKTLPVIMYIIPVVVVLFILVSICGSLVYWAKRRRFLQGNKQQCPSPDNGLSAPQEVERPPVEARHHLPAHSVSPSTEVDTVYENVNAHQATVTTTAPQKAARSDPSPSVDTVYYSLQLPVSNVLPDGRSKTEDRQHATACTSEGEDAQRHNTAAHVESVYSTIQPVRTHPEEADSATGADV